MGRLSDIAGRAGVSEATVSRVLNNRAGVSGTTRAAVLDAADTLGLRPTPLKRRVVALMVPELHDPFFADMTVLLVRMFRDRRLPVTVSVTGGSGELGEPEQLRVMTDLDAAGIVFVGGLCNEGDADHDHYRVLAHSGRPAVLMNASVPDLGLPVIGCDDGAAVELAWRHLRWLGHERIGIIMGARDHIPSRAKVAALRQLGDQGEPFEPAAVRWTDYQLESATAQAELLLRQGFRAFLAQSDQLALGVVRAARRHGLSVPEDVSVVGYDDSRLLPFLAPALTTVRQPMQAMARGIVSEIMAQIGGRRPEGTPRLLEPELVVRDSTAPARR